jgi:hypothetical protein
MGSRRSDARRGFLQALVNPELADQWPTWGALEITAEASKQHHGEPSVRLEDTLLSPRVHHPAFT